MNAVLKSSRKNAPSVAYKGQLYSNPEDPTEEFVVMGQLKVHVWSTKAAARELGISPRRIERLAAEFQIKPAKTLIYKQSRTRVPGFLLADIIEALEKKTEQMHLEGNLAQRFKGKDKMPEHQPNAKHPRSEELRLTKARADKAELELAEAASELVELSTVVNDVGDMLSAFRARLLGMAPKFAASLPVDLRSEAEAAARLLVNESLEEIAQYRPKVHRKAGSDDEAASDTES